MRFSLRIKISLIYGLSGSYLLGSTFKDTTTIIQEWVQTEQLISEETTEWNVEKAALMDIRDALKTEIIELDKRLEESEEEAVGAAKQRTELLEQKNEIEETTRSLLEGVDALQIKVEETFKILPLHLQNDCNRFVRSSRIKLKITIFL